MEAPFTIAAAADYLSVTREHLAQLRFYGTGPTYLRPTPRRILYLRSDLDSWLEESRVIPSVSRRAA